MSISRHFWGKVAMFNLYGCRPRAIRCPKTIDEFSRELVKEIGMEAFGPPQIVHFGEGNKAGYTLVQLITTSNITAHFVEATDDIYLDVFSCKDFKSETVEDVIVKYFDPKRMIHQEILR